jgi:hypothetical protein
MTKTPLSEFQRYVRVKQTQIQPLTDLIINHDRILAAALENLTEKNETIRYNSYRAIKAITESQPGIIYPHWDFFASQLQSPNAYHILSGIHILADLSRVDTEAKFERIFTPYYELLNHRSMVVVSHVCLASGRLMRYKPGLAHKIEDILLNIDQHIQKQKQKDLIKGAVLEAFTEARSVTRRKQEIREFATQLLDSPESPKSRKLASRYLADPD